MYVVNNSYTQSADGTWSQSHRHMNIASWQCHPLFLILLIIFFFFLLRGYGEGVALTSKEKVVYRNFRYQEIPCIWSFEILGSLAPLPRASTKQFLMYRSTIRARKAFEHRQGSWDGQQGHKYADHKWWLSSGGRGICHHLAIMSQSSRHTPSFAVSSRLFHCWQWRWGLWEELLSR